METTEPHVCPCVSASRKNNHRPSEQLNSECDELEADCARGRREKSWRRRVVRHPFGNRIANSFLRCLPGELYTYAPDGQARPDFGGKLQSLGEDTTEMLEYARACFLTIGDGRLNLFCAACDRIGDAPTPSWSHRPRPRRTRTYWHCRISHSK